MKNNKAENLAKVTKLFLAGELGTKALAQALYEYETQSSSTASKSKANAKKSASKKNSKKASNKAGSKEQRGRRVGDVPAPKFVKDADGKLIENPALKEANKVEAKEANKPEVKAEQPEWVGKKFTKNTKDRTAKIAEPKKTASKEANKSKNKDAETAKRKATAQTKLVKLIKLAKRRPTDAHLTQALNYLVWTQKFGMVDEAEWKKCEDALYEVFEANGVVA